MCVYVCSTSVVYLGCHGRLGCYGTFSEGTMMEFENLEFELNFHANIFEALLYSLFFPITAGIITLITIDNQT